MEPDGLTIRAPKPLGNHQGSRGSSKYIQTGLSTEGERSLTCSSHMRAWFNNILKAWGLPLAIQMAAQLETGFEGCLA